MSEQSKVWRWLNFRRFFLHGVGVLLPTVLTIWILIAAYGFVQQRIAEPINLGIRNAVLWFTFWPIVVEEEIQATREGLTAEQRKAWLASGGESNRSWLVLQARSDKLENWWGRYALPLNMIGLVIAVVGIYLVGIVLGSLIGKRIYTRGEQLIYKLPLVKQVYPSIKQVTDFFVGNRDNQLRFSRVVAVQYPRKGLWSVGLMTGDTMRAIQDEAGHDCITVFVPSSPTPFTGYVITVPREDTIDLPVSIEEALRFTISGGVILPSDQDSNPDRLSSPNVGDRTVTGFGQTGGLVG